KKAKNDNDIHLVLEEAPGADVCERIIAEISPHLRPSTWARHILQRLRRHPVRVTGQLFFDSVHRPCTRQKRHYPARISVWEIHPVYNIEVCKKKHLSHCRADQDWKWVPLPEWLGSKGDGSREGASLHGFNSHKSLLNGTGG